MKKIYSPSIIIAFLTLLSCSAPKETGFEINGHVNEELILEFSENLFPISMITSFDFINEETLVISTENNQIIYYDNKGNQKFKIDQFGEGQYELLSPKLIRVLNDRLYVWCNQLLKIVVFDNNGRAIDEYKGFKKAIKDFTVSKDHIFLYTTGRLDDNYISVYDKKERFELGSYGFIENEQILVNLNNCAGGMAFVNNTLLFSPSNQLMVEALNLETFDSQMTIFEDKDFKVEKLNQDAGYLMNNEREKAFKYSMSNSVITGVLSSDDHILLTTEIGSIEEIDNILSNSNRNEKFFLLNHNLDIVKSYTNPHSFYNPCSLFGANKDGFYRIKIREGETEMVYELFKMNF